MKKVYFIAIGIITIFSVVILLSKNSSASNFENINAMTGDIEIYKSLTCGCCSVYSSYVDSKVSPKVKSIDLQDIDKINQLKTQYGVPKELESCHTMIVGDYFIEGHIPLEAVEKLIKEHPNIAGIAMPGMPSGSPGMPGSKSGSFVIFAVNNDGTYSEFMRI